MSGYDHWFPVAPNAGGELLPEAEAQRTLEAVSSRPWFGAGMGRDVRLTVERLIRMEPYLMQYGKCLLSNLL